MWSDRISTSALACCCESAANRGLRSPARKTAIELSRSLFRSPLWVNALADYGRRGYGACFGRDLSRLALGAYRAGFALVQDAERVRLRCPRFLYQGLWEYGLSNG